MKEAYCSYEISKLLKEKGFDEECFGAYTETNHNITMFTGLIKNSEYGNAMYTAPTHQMAMAWLRERNIGITPEIHITQDPKDYFWSATIFYLDKPWDIIQFVSAPSKSLSEGYDDVIEQSIKYALENLLKEEQQ